MRTAHSWKEVEIPKKLRKRPKDRRGFPIPYTATLDKQKQPHFDVIDEERKQKCATKGLCQLCGDPLRDVKGPDGGGWLIGGPICFTHPQGAFLDPPMHRECAEYALAVCPYLALPSYSKLIDGKRLTDENRPEEIVVVAEDIIEGRPEAFMLGQCAGYEAFPMGNGMAVRVPNQDWVRLFLWKDGAVVEDEDERKRLLALDAQRHTG